MLRLIFVTFGVFLLSLSLNGQTDADFSFFSSRKSSKKVYNVINAKADKNEVALTVEILYRFYKSNLSSQDGSRCSFYPSCADYCKQAIHKHGLIKGGIHAMDRLTRCNGFSPHKYAIDMKRRKLLDDVQ